MYNLKIVSLIYLLIQIHLTLPEKDNIFIRNVGLDNVNSLSVNQIVGAEMSSVICALKCLAQEQYNCMSFGYHNASLTCVLHQTKSTIDTGKTYFNEIGWTHFDIGKSILSDLYRLALFI